MAATLQRLEAERGKLELERRLHEERMQELTAEAGQLRASMQAVAADCKTVHAALMRVLRENGELRAQLDAERLIRSALPRGCALVLPHGCAAGPPHLWPCCKVRCIRHLLAGRAACWCHWFGDLVRKVLPAVTVACIRGIHRSAVCCASRLTGSGTCMCLLGTACAQFVQLLLAW